MDVFDKKIKGIPLVFCRFPERCLDAWEQQVSCVTDSEEIAAWFEFFSRSLQKEELFIINPFDSPMEDSYDASEKDVISYLTAKTGITDAEKIEEMQVYKNITAMMKVMQEKRHSKEAVLGVAVCGGVLLDYYKTSDEIHLFVTVLHEVVHMLEEKAVSFFPAMDRVGKIYGALEKKAPDNLRRYEKLLRIRPQEMDIPQEIKQLGEYQGEDMQTEALTCAVEAAALCVLKQYDKERCLGKEFSLEDALVLVKNEFHV